MTSPIQTTSALDLASPARTTPSSPLIGGAQDWMGNQRDYLKGLGTPEGSDVLNSLIQLAQLQALVKILELLQQKPPANDGGKDEGGAAKPGGKAPGGKAPGGKAPGGPGKGEPKLENVGGRQAIKVDGPGNFLWKPVSDSDRNAVALLPKEMAGAQVSVKGPDGATIAEPKRTDTFSDGRGIFRFGKPGASFPPGAYVEARMPDGTTKRFPLADPSQRND